MAITYSRTQNVKTISFLLFVFQAYTVEDKNCSSTYNSIESSSRENQMTKKTKKNHMYIIDYRVSFNYHFMSSDILIYYIHNIVMVKIVHYRDGSRMQDSGAQLPPPT